MITLQTIKPSNVVLPNVFRYMEKKYIDLFFDKGIIRLGSFSRFQKYPDEIRGDESEGKGAIQSKSKEGFQVVGVTEVGNDAYILCTSIIDSEELMGEFNTDGCFRIKDPLGFPLQLQIQSQVFHKPFRVYAIIKIFDWLTNYSLICR